MIFPLKWELHIRQILRVGGVGAGDFANYTFPVILYRNIWIWESVDPSLLYIM